MKRNFLLVFFAAIVLCGMLSIITLGRAGTAEREALPLGRYACVRVSDGSTLPGLNLLSKDKYEKGDQTGIYVYEAGERRIEWLSGPIPKQLVGFYVPKGVDNASNDTI